MENRTICSDTDKNLTIIPFPQSGEEPKKKQISEIIQRADVSNLIDSLKSYLNKFSFEKSAIELWLHKYKFVNKDNHTVNRSKQSINAHIKYIINNYSNNNDNNDNNVINLIGEIGSGKSTFNKYITTFYFDEFKESNILCSRIEFSKLIKFVDSYKTHNNQNNDNLQIRDAVSKFIEICLIRDVLHFLFSKQNTEITGSPFLSVNPGESSKYNLFDIRINNSYEQFKVFLQKNLNIEKNKSDTIASNLSNFLCYYSNLSRIDRMEYFHKIKISVSRNNTDSIKIIYDLSYLARFLFENKSNNIKAFIIFDGMDYIEINDLISESKNLPAKIIEIIKNIITTDNCNFILPSSNGVFKPILQLSMRTNTKEYFLKEYNSSLPGVKFDQINVSSPDLKEIARGISETVYLRSQLKHKQHVSSIIRNSCESLIYEINRHSAENWSLINFDLNDVFNGNVRNFLTYLDDVLWDALLSALGQIDSSERKKTKRNPRDLYNINPIKLLQTAAIYVEQSTREHPRQSLAIALSSREMYYRNFVRIEYGSGGEVILSDNDRESGYIGNIFNYHVNYAHRNSFVEFINKIILFDIIDSSPDQSNSGISIDNINSEFRDNCKKCNVSDINLALRIMLREGIISIHYNAGSLHYKPTKVGQLIRYKLMYNLIYYENVFFGCYIPHSLRSCVKITTRNPKAISLWVEASYANVTVMLYLMNTAIIKGGADIVDIAQIVNSIKTSFDLIESAGDLSLECLDTINNEFFSDKIICSCDE